MDTSAERGLAETHGVPRENVTDSCSRFYYTIWDGECSVLSHTTFCKWKDATVSFEMDAVK